MMMELIDKQKAIYIASGFCHWSNIPKELEKLPTVQAVPIETVLDILEKEGHKWGNNYCDWVDAIEEIKNLPSVNPQEKTGHWIDTGSGQECSECHEIQYGYDSNRKYCANCGVRMVGDNNDR